MKQPSSFQSDPVPGPNYDPLDAIVQNLQNIESFLDHLSDNSDDFVYLNTHLSSILSLRRTLSHELDKLSNDPYFYSSERLKKLHEENERIFIFLEGVVGEMIAKDKKKFKKCVEALEEALSKFDDEVTP